MKRQILISSLILLFAAAFAIADDLPYKPGEVLVRFADVQPGVRLPGGLMIVGPLKRQAIRSEIANFAVSGATVVKEYDHIVAGLTLVKLPEGVGVLDAVARLNRSANILYAEPNYKIKAVQRFPNDPLFDQQWGLHNTGQTGGTPDADIDAPEAWDMHTGSSSVIVAVLDTGIDYNHPDLWANMWINPGEVSQPGVVGPNDFNNVDDDGNGYIDDIYGYDFIDDDSNPNDENFHGTHVAGIIGAGGNNAIGVSGVCWNVNLMALRFLDAFGSGTTTDAIEGIDYAVTMNANVINASWGGYGYSQSLYDAIARVRDAGTLFVAAAGNDGENIDNILVGIPFYPASYNLDNIIAVLATDHYDNMAWFSNYGPTAVDLGAPGSDILSTFPTDETPAMTLYGFSTDYETISGTSMAAPFVSGACALVKAVRPNFTYSQIKTIILHTVDPTLAGLCVSGGRLNLFKAVSMARPGVVLNKRTENTYPTIQGAINEAIDADELIAEAHCGYFENIDFNGVKVLLRSGDVNAPPDYGVIQPASTYISALFDANGPVVTINSGEDAGAVLSGFTVSDGNVGGIFIDNNSSPVITNCIITLNRTHAAGGGIYCANSLADINSCNIYDNTADANGGGIYCANSLADINSCNIYDNTADVNGNGGGIYCDNSSLKITNSYIYYNTSDANGGGIYCANSLADINDCNIYDNMADANGGGIYCVNSLPNINHCDIYWNYAIASGGGIYCDSSFLRIADCNIFTHDAGRDGAGIYCSNNSDANISNCTIRDNWSYNGQGGGIYCSNDSDLNISNSRIIGDNRSWNGPGGGIYCENDSNLSINNSTISDNYAYIGGGGIYCSNGSEPNITNCIISGNYTITIPDDEQGGGYGGQGGGIYCSDAPKPSIIGCTIASNWAYWEGGGIYCANSPPEINDCNISGNTSFWDGGGIYCDEDSEPNIRNSMILNNVADYDSGGIYLNGGSSLIKNCLIVGNRAVYWDAGGVFCWDASPTITNCTFAKNSSSDYDGLGGAIYCLGTSKPIVTDCIFSDNNNIAIYEGDIGSDAKVRWSLFYNNLEGDYFDSGTGLVYTGPGQVGSIPGGSNNLYGNPMFVRGRLGTYYLSQFAAGQILDANGVQVDPNVNPGDANSPAVDAGSGDANDPNIAMHLYSTRTDNVADSGKVDIGYHYFDPCAPVYFNLTISIVPTDSGVISFLDPNRSDINCPPNFIVKGYIQYSQVPLAATAIDPCHYQFKSWQGTDDDTRIELDPSGGILRVQHNIVTIDANETVTVTFENVWVYLRTRVILGSGTVTPRQGTYPRGTVVGLTASPANPSNRARWYGSDDDLSTLLANTVTMVAPFIIDPQGREFKIVEVEFYAPRTLYVPDDYPTIQAAIDDAYNGDTIEISAAPGPYITSWGYEISGKAITITSTNPDDPCCVANTVIQKEVGPEGSGRSCFHFWNVGRNTVLNGLTLREFSGIGYDGLDGDPTLGFYDGVPGGDVAGGAIICISNASPTIKNCIIRDCNIIGGDGGNGADGAGGTPPPPPHIDGGHGGWPGRAYGGGMAFLDGSSPLVLNCTFVNCSVVGGNGGDGGNGAGEPDCGYGGRGGGYYYSDPPRYPYDFGPFDLYTQYSGHGGAVYVGPGCSPEFIDCNFIDNTSGSGTNGISGQYGCPPEDRDEPSIRWKIDNFGGAVYVAGNSTARFIGCAFNGNLADTNNLPESSDLFVSYGGAIAFEDGADLTIEDCTFSDNVATIGGGIYSSHSDPLIDDCNFVGNSALHGGGALFVSGTANITRSNFGENEATATAGQGGGICCLGANAGIVDCNIANNDANGSGGGIYISSKNVNGQEVAGENTVLVENCLITGNFASRDGGGISANWHSDPNIVNCTIADNVVTGTGFGAGYGGGLCCSYGNYTNIINSIIWGNSGQRGPQLAIGSGFEYDPRPSTVNVSYSDVQGGQSYVFIDEDCTLNWGAGNIHINPLFVTGPLGGYYLSQIAAGQPLDSNCVDTGSDSAENLGMNSYTTRTDEKPDRKTVDMGYHHPFTPEAEPCRFCELVRDGIINFKDFAIFALNWLSEDCNPADKWCQHADVTFDTYVNFEDVELFAECWLVEDTYPPVPNPSEWKIEPYSSSSPEHPDSISMTAETASDAWDFWVGNVQYYFDCVYGDCNDSGWQNDPNYIDPNLVVGVEYGYRVRASDVSEPNNKTEWSLIRYAVVGEVPPPPEDHDTPKPDPMTWASVPTATGSTSITMTATTADDNTPPVEYYFEDVNFPTVNSGWWSSPTWVDTTCEPNTTYTYRVKARDSAIPHNETGWSDPCSATTTAETPPNNPPAPVAWEVEPYETGSELDAYANMTAQVAIDPEGSAVQYYFECVDIPSINSGWMTERVWNSVSIGRAGQGLEFRFKVRDLSPDLKESGWSTSLPCY